MPSNTKINNEIIRAALSSRFKSILNPTETDDPNKVIIEWPQSIALRMMSEKREKVAMNFMSFWRIRSSFDWQRNRTVLSRRGMETEIEGQAANVTVIPVRYEYSLNLFTNDLDKMMQLIESYLWWQQDNPTIDVTINDIPLSPQLHFGEVTEIANVDNMFKSGLYYHYTAPLIMDGWGVRVVTEDLHFINSVHLDIYYHDSLTQDTYSLVIDENSSDYDADLARILLLSEQEITE